MKSCKFILVFLSTIILFTACSKDSNDNKPKTKTDLISQASWKFNSASASGFGDVSSQIPACYKDNTYTFVSGGTGTVDESTNVCSPSTAGSFTWNFANNETGLHISTRFLQAVHQDFTYYFPYGNKSCSFADNDNCSSAAHNGSSHIYTS